MAKVFKVIMNILIILFIAALVALFIPPLLGITTVTAKPGVQTNMQVGSVAYGTRKSLNELQPGDTIISNTDDETWLYEITRIDPAAGELTVRTSETAEPETITLRRTASKKVLVVPFIGYIIIALQTTEGMIILGLAAALLVILFIISDILCRKSRDKEEEEDDLTEEERDRQYFNDLAASQNRPSRLDELGTISIPQVADLMESEQTLNNAGTLELDEELETPELILETVSSSRSSVPTDMTQQVTLPARNRAKGNAADTDSLMTIDLVETESEPAAETPAADRPAVATPAPADAKPAETAPAEKAPVQAAPAPAETAPVEKAPAPAEQATFQAAPAEAASAEKAPAPAEAAPAEKAPAVEPVPAAQRNVSASNTAELSGIGSALENALSTAQMNRTAPAPAAPAPETETAPAAPPEEIELAIPQRTLDELLQEAYANGEDPKVTKDAAIGVTFVDYSNCL